MCAPCLSSCVLTVKLASHDDCAQVLNKPESTIARQRRIPGMWLFRQEPVLGWVTIYFRMSFRYYRWTHQRPIAYLFGEE